MFLLVCFPSVTRAERLPLKAYTTAEGLAHNAINKIVRDSRGFLWFCTADGLSRFDGYTFTNYGTDQGLPHRNVTDFLETREGEFWVATNGGLVRFNPKGRPEARVVYANNASLAPTMFTVVVPDDEDQRARTFSVLLEDHSGAIWCGTHKGLYRLELTSGRYALHAIDIGIPSEYPELAFIWDLLQDRHGSLWVATPSGLYRRWPDGSSARYTKRDGLPDHFLHHLFEDHQGHLWVATRSSGFFRLVADDTHSPPTVARAYSTRDGLPTNWVFQLFETSAHKFWVATDRGLVEFFADGDEQGRRFRAYTAKNGLSHHEVTALNEDSGGNLWLGTSTAGAMKLAREGFITYDQQDGVVGVNAIFEDRAGGVCFRGSVLGDERKSVFEGAKLDLLRRQPDVYFTRFGRFDSQGFTWFRPNTLNATQIGWVGEEVTLQSRSGEFWVGTGFGLYRFSAADNFTHIRNARPLTIYTTKDGLASAQVFRLFEDSRGNVWISTISSVGNGLARWERAVQTLQDLAKSPGLPSLKDDLPRSFGEDSAGNVWVGFNSGLARYRDGRFTFFATNDGLPPGAIMNIYRDRAGRLWLASARGGLVRVDNVEAERPAFISYTTAQGLSSNDTEVITEDLHGHIYLGTGHGLDRLDPATDRVKHFTTADGLAPGAFLAAFRDRGGALWFGTMRGLSRLNPAADEPTAAVPPILIIDLRIAGAHQLVSALGESEIFLPDAAASENQLQIDFVGLSFAPGEVLRYQYKLEAADADWSAPTEQRSVNYARLAPGRYKFLVRAVNSDGVISSNPAVVTFRILPPIWQQWWFLTLAAMAFALGVYGLYRNRVARLLEVERIRTRIATDLHDDIGSNLSLIAMASEVAGRRVPQADSQIAEWLSLIANTSRATVDSMSDIVWAVNPGKDRVGDLTQRMRRVADDIFTTRDIVFHFSAQDANANQTIGSDTRREVFMIFKEAVNNIARHSACAHADVELSIAKGWLELKLSDDGRGFDVASASDGNGLASMRRRASNLGGILQITSQPGNGTTIVLKARMDGHFSSWR